MPRIWASLDDFLPPSAGPEQVGRNMANHYFLRALLRHGTFDEYHFFLCNEAHGALFWRCQGPLLDELGVRDKVRVFSRTALPQIARQVDYTAFHLSDHVTLMDALCRVRNRLGASFPVSGFIHSVSYGEFMGRYLEMLHGGMNASDVILCSSSQGELAVRRSLARLSCGLGLSLPKVGFEVVPLGIDDGSAMPSALQRSEQRAAARMALGLPQDAVVGLCFGRFSEVDKMDHMPLVQAFSALPRDGQAHHLVLAGSVQSEAYYRILEVWCKALGVGDRVKLERAVDEARKLALYQAADYFVSVSDNPQETFGLTLLEALRAGLPLVVSDYDGYRDIATDDVALRVPTTWYKPSELELIEPILDPRTFHLFMAQCLSVDLPSLTLALQTLAVDKAQRAKLAEAAEQRFKACYRHDRTIAKLEAIWDERKRGFVTTRQSADPMSLAAFETFSHYPTRFLEEKDSVKRTTFGQRLHNTKASHPLLAGLAELIDPAAVTELLQSLEQSATVEQLQASSKAPAWKTGYTLAWMLKHGLVEVV